MLAEEAFLLAVSLIFHGLSGPLESPALGSLGLLCTLEPSKGWVVG